MGFVSYTRLDLVAPNSKCQEIIRELDIYYNL